MVNQLFHVVNVRAGAIASFGVERRGSPFGTFASMLKFASSLAALLIASLSLAACGSTSNANANRNAPAAPSLVRVSHMPFSITTLDGRVTAMRDDGFITVNGEEIGHIELDGRFVVADGSSLGALLPDGRISFGGELAPWRIEGARVFVDGALAASIIDSSLVPATDASLSVPVLGLTEENRSTVLYVMALQMLAPAAEPDVADEGRVFYRFPVDGAPSRGPRDALVTIVAVEDFQCPFCARATTTLERIRETYGADVRIVFHHNPLPFHDHAMPAAEATLEAFAQRGDDGFWAMHDLLFENQQSLERADLERFAMQLGLDMDSFRRALDGGIHRAAITEDQTIANRFGANGTPSFFINGVRVMGAQPFESFSEVIDAELARARRLARRGIPSGRIYETVTANGLLRGEAPEYEHQPVPARPRPDPNAVYRVPVGASPVRGRADALVTVVIFSDFQCPFCARVEPTLEQLRTQYGSDIRFVWKNNPLPFHDNAMPAAEAALEVFAQTGERGFWAFHDLLFENQTSLDRASLERLAQQIPGVRMPRFRRALDQHTHQAIIEADQELARQLGATGTPSFFINGRNLRGAQPIQAFRTAIDQALADARQRVQQGTPAADVYDAITGQGATSQVLLPAEGEAPPPPSAPPATPATPADVAAPPASAHREPSGLASRVIVAGTGTRHPTSASRVVVHYSGWTTDGALFDSSRTRGEPATFPVNAVIPGFAAGVLLMVEGEQRRIWIPEALAYRGQHAPFGMLVFDIELIRIED